MSPGCGLGSASRWNGIARAELHEAKLLLSKAISGIRVARSGGY